MLLHRNVVTMNWPQSLPAVRLTKFYWSSPPSVLFGSEKDRYITEISGYHVSSQFMVTVWCFPINIFQEETIYLLSQNIDTFNLKHSLLYCIQLNFLLENPIHVSIQSMSVVNSPQNYVKYWAIALLQYTQSTIGTLNDNVQSVTHIWSVWPGLWTWTGAWQWYRTQWASWQCIIRAAVAQCSPTVVMKYFYQFCKTNFCPPSVGSQWWQARVWFQQVSRGEWSSSIRETGWRSRDFAQDKSIFHNWTVAYKFSGQETDQDLYHFCNSYFVWLLLYFDL